MTDTQEALKPCPFCGSDEVSHSEGSKGDGSPWHYVECEACAAVTDTDVWNRRATPEAETPAVRVKELEWEDEEESSTAVVGGYVHLVELSHAGAG